MSSARVKRMREVAERRGVVAKKVVLLPGVKRLSTLEQVVGWFPSVLGFIGRRVARGRF